MGRKRRVPLNGTPKEASEEVKPDTNGEMESSASQPQKYGIGSREEYLQLKRDAAEVQRSLASQYDKAVLTVAAGAFIVSVTFVKEIAPQPMPWSCVLLVLAWIAFVLAMLSTLVSFQTSMKAHKEYEKLLDQLHREPERLPKEDPKNDADKQTDQLNSRSLIALKTGAVFLLLFAGVNLPWSSIVGDQKTTGTENVTATPSPSAVPATPTYAQGGAMVPELPVAQQTPTGPREQRGSPTPTLPAQQPPRPAPVTPSLPVTPPTKK